MGPIFNENTPTRLISDWPFETEGFHVVLKLRINIVLQKAMISLSVRRTRDEAVCILAWQLTNVATVCLTFD
nr:hypothetical protein [Tanacetum cinerariifolium]